MPYNESVSVDHFQPKSRASELAYEWDNFRLTTARVNWYKGSHTDVLDPIGLAQGLFQLDFTTFLVRANPSAGVQLKQSVNSTIARLRLNTDDDLVQSRIMWLRAFVQRQDVGWLAARAPFLAQEVTRQGALTNLVALFARLPMVQRT